MLTIEHNDKEYPQVKEVTAYPKVMPALVATYKPVAVSLDQFRAGTAIPAWVPWTWCAALKKMVSPAERIATCREIADDCGTPKGGMPVPF